MELAVHDPQVERSVSAFFKAMETRVGGALSRAKAEGELADGVEPAIAARLLICVAEGMLVMGKTVQNRATTQATVDALFDQFIK